MSACPRRHELYRSRLGIFLGVCRGLSEYAQISPIWVRLAFILLAITTAFFPVALAYLILAIVMKPEPSYLPATEDECAFYDVYASSRKAAVGQVKRRLAELDRRARRIEDIVTSRSYDWDRRFQTGQ